jgi:DNA-binding transcriptional MerR regulator
MLTTPQVCKRVGISRATLHAYIRRGLAAPPRTTVGRVTARRWTPADIAELQKFRSGLKPGRRRGARFPQGYKKNAN